MDYEKKYKEALERAKGMHEQGMMPERLEYVFPELKESEDERIKKELISFLQLPHPQFVGERKQEKWIAWLEKQAEHANFRNKIQIGDKVTRNKDGVLVNLSQLKRVAKKDEKQGEQKPNYNNKELKDVVIEELSKYNNNCLNTPWATDSTGLQYPLYFANLGAKWQKKQKSVWSEKDEAKLKSILFHIEDVENKDVIDWFKSLKDRVQPQNRWKPSGFHLECISDAIAIYEERSINAIGLKEILEELKKLREE